MSHIAPLSYIPYMAYSAPTASPMTHKLPPFSRIAATYMVRSHLTIRLLPHTSTTLLYLHNKRPWPTPIATHRLSLTALHTSRLFYSNSGNGCFVHGYYRKRYFVSRTRPLLLLWVPPKGADGGARKSQVVGGHLKYYINWWAS